MIGKPYTETSLSDSRGCVEWWDGAGIMNRVILGVDFATISLATPVVPSIILLTHALDISADVVRWWTETHLPTNEAVPEGVVKKLALSFHTTMEAMSFICANQSTLDSFELTMLAIRTLLDRRGAHPFSAGVERLMGHLYTAVADSGEHLLREMLFHDKHYRPELGFLDSPEGSPGTVRVLYQHFMNPWMKEQKYHQCLPGQVVFAVPRFETSNAEQRGAVAGLAYLERLVEAAKDFQRYLAVPTEVLARRVKAS